MANVQPVQPVSIERLRTEFYQENWVWDSATKGEHVILSNNQRAAYFHTDPVLDSTGTAGVRGTKGFQDGEHYWEITFLEPPTGTSVMVGVGTRDAKLNMDDYNFVDLIGRDEHSWGLSYKGNTWHKGQCTRYCDPFYDQSTIIGIHLNLYTGTITFYKDGHSLGVAFKGIQTSDREFFPIICSTAAETELEVGIQTCRYMNLQEKCCLIVAQNVGKKDNIEQLPLPNVFKKHLNSIKCDFIRDL